jgi:hypothetical protein
LNLDRSKSTADLKGPARLLFEMAVGCPFLLKYDKDYVKVINIQQLSRTRIIMKKSRMVYGIAAVGIGVIIMQCNNNSGPTAPKETLPGTVILSEGFEGDLSNYRQVVYTDGQALMSLSKQCAHSGTGSLTSDSNNTSIKRSIDPYIQDSIAGLQFYLMATKAAHTNFLVAICKPGSSANGLFTIIGMGIDKSDSLKYFYQETPDPAGITSENFAALTLNKWYECKIEYDFTDTTLTYYVDDALVCQRPASNPMALQTFVVMRDNLGAQGASGYYLDDVCIYKR